MRVLINRYSQLPKQLKASVWFFVCTFIQKGISVFTTPIFTRILSTEEYGSYSVFNTWLSLITVFITMQMSSGVYMQSIVKHEEEIDSYSACFQGLSLCLVTMWTLIYLAFHDFWNFVLQMNTSWMLSMLLLIWLNSVYSLWATEQRVKLNYKGLVALTLFVSLLRPACEILAIQICRDKVSARIITIVIVELLAYVWLFIVQIMRGKCFFRKDIWKYALTFSIPLIPHYLSQNVLNSADRIMIERFVGKSEAGIYTLAYSISLFMDILKISILQTLSPWIYQKIRDRRLEKIRPVAMAMLCLIALGCLLFIVFAPELVSLFAPLGYYEAIWVIPPISMSVFFTFAYNLFVAFEFYYKKTHYIAFASIIGAILNVVLNWIFIPSFGYMAAGYTTLFCYIVYTLMHYCFMLRTCKEMKEDVQVYNPTQLFVIASLFLCMGFTCMLSYNYSTIRYSLLFIVLIIIIVYALRNGKTIIERMKNNE